jgi:AbrB family looped-hinge helix DNA binding protein
MSEEQTIIYRSPAKVNTEGRVLIPAHIRHHLGIEPGDVLYIELHDHSISLVTHSTPVHKQA